MTDATRQRLQAADAYCRFMVRHYENFTVASRLTPRALRRDLARVYAFCRTTDDFGDETGDADLAAGRLTAWRRETESLFNGAPPLHPVLVALAPTVQRHRLTAQPFLDLVDANLQDQHVATYEDWAALLGYCRLSAAPVGRIVLKLFGIDDARAEALSDDVCIGLQLANFAQDVGNDKVRGRTYLLQSDIREAGEAHAAKLMCERARDLLASGRELEAMAPRRLRIQLALYRLGGEAILDAIAACGYRTSQTRPSVTRRARIGVGWRALGSVVRSDSRARVAREGGARRSFVRSESVASSRSAGGAAGGSPTASSGERRGGVPATTGPAPTHAQVASDG